MNIKTISLTLLTVCLVSCKDEAKIAEEKALMEKYETQKDLLVSLETTIERLDKKLREEQIQDPSEDIKKIKQEVEEAEARRVSLKKEIAELRSKQAEAKAKLDSYKTKYPIKSN